MYPTPQVTSLTASPILTSPMDVRDYVATTFADCIARLDPVLQPYGFDFQSDGISSSHTGPYGSGYYVRGFTRIGLSCRHTIDNVIYEHTFVTEHSTWREIERYSISHYGLMRKLGHADDAQLVAGRSVSEAVVARDGRDAVDALVFDLSTIVLPLVREPANHFLDTIRQGYRAYDVR